jgi:transposase-like protein
MSFIARVLTTIDCTRASTVPQFLPDDSNQAEFVICYQSIEQDHRTVKKRVWLAKGYGSFQSAWRTLQGIEVMHMIRKGRVRWLSKGDAIGQAHFIAKLFGVAA